jgi:hypothetical protein
MHNRKYPDGVMTLISIDYLKINSKVLLMIGEGFFFMS